MITSTGHDSQPGCSQDVGCLAQEAGMQGGSSYTATLIAQAAGGMSEETDAAVPLEAI